MVTFFSFIRDITCIKDSCKRSEIDFTNYCWLWLLFEHCNYPLNGCNDILCVNVSEACFDRSMHDLLQTSTSCHFKICLKSHTTGTTAGRDPTVAFLAQFYSTPLQKVKPGIIIQQPLYSWEKLTDSAVYQWSSLVQLLDVHIDISAHNHVEVWPFRLITFSA